MVISERQISLPVSSGLHGPLRSDLGAPILLALIVFAACLFGIFTRPVGFLATLWPANAILLGLLIHFPKTAGPAGWLGAGIAYVAADLLTGASMEKAIVLNGANLAGVAAGYIVYRRESGNATGLQHSASMFHLLFASAAAGAAAGAIGALANPLLFDGGVLEGWAFWFATELVNYVTFLPVILSLPNGSQQEIRLERLRDALTWKESGPALAVIGSCLVAIVGSGPGAIAFPVPALLWCGLTYPVFRTALMTAFFGCWALMVMGSGLLPHYAEPFDEKALVSIRIAVALVSMAPIMLASVMHSRNELLAILRHQATHDSLTGLANRGAFRDSAASLLSEGKPLAIMMIDIDRFKTINDRFGHAGGDAVLVSFADRVRRCLRGGDLFARLGGEEFAIMIEGCTEPEARSLADRVLAAIRNTPVSLNGDRDVPVTASLGLVFAPGTAALDVDDLLAEADRELYKAKQNGRDRVEVSVRTAS